MRTSRTRRRRIGIIYRLLIAAALGLFIVVLARGVWGIYDKYERARKERSQAEEEYEELRARERTLSQELTDLESGRGLEAELRSRFQVARPGEQAVIIVDPPAGESGAPSEDRSLWERIKRWFGWE